MIDTGYTEVEDYVLNEDKNYELLSRWTSSNSVHCDDGETAESKFKRVLYIESFDSATGTLVTSSY